MILSPPTRLVCLSCGEEGKWIWPATEIVTFQLKMIAIAKSHKKHENLQKKEMKGKQSQTVGDVQLDNAQKHAKQIETK